MLGYALRLLLLSLLFLPFQTQAKRHLKFESIMPAQGLLSPFVHGVVQDHHGFIWIAQQTGLQRFDGNGFVHFRQDPNRSNGLVSNVIACLMVDHNNDIWVGTSKGLNIYHQSEQRFSRLTFDVPEHERLKANQIRTFKQDSEGNIWIGTQLGLIRYAVKTAETEVFRQEGINAIEPLSDNRLLIGTWADGLFEFDINSGQFMSLNALVNPPFGKLRITSIIKTAPHTFAVATWGKGVYEFNQSRNTLIPILAGLSNPFIRTLAKEHNGPFWVATASGLQTIDQAAGISRVIELDTAEAKDDAERRITHFYQGAQNTLWLSSGGYGLFKFAAKTRQMGHYLPNRPNDSSLQDKVVLDFAQTPSGKILAAKLSGAIAVFDPQTQNFRHLTLQQNGQAFNGIISAIVALSEHEVLVSSYPESFIVGLDGTVQELSQSRQSELLSNITLVASNQPRHSDVLFAYRDNNLLILGQNEQHQLYIKQQFDLALNAITNIGVQKLSNSFVTEQGDVYLSDVAGGVFKVSNFDSKQPKVTLIRQRDLSYIDSIAMDKQGNLWVAVNGVKLQVFPRLGEPYYYDGFDEAISGFGSLQYLADINQLWLTHSGGISNIDLDHNRVYHYDTSDGVAGGLEESVATLVGRDGTLYFGARHGFNRFSPSLLKPDMSGIEVKLTDFLLGGKKLSPHQGHAVLSRAVTDTQQITLDHKQNAFGFEFAALMAPFGQNLTFAYQLAGYDKGWTYVDSNKRFANYTNIAPGHYRFKVKVQTKNRVWSEQDTVMDIVIAPPWWQTLPAYFVYIFLVVAAIWGIVKLRTVALTRRSVQLEASVKQRTLELGQEKQKVEQLLAQKDEDFANISHEFRTPLTLILGPLQQLKQQLDDATALGQLQTIENNGYRLLRMVDQILNMESLAAEGTQQLVRLDVAATIKAVLSGFSDTAKNKQIAIEVGQLDEILCEFTQDAFEQVLLNLVSNAIKYTQAGGKVVVSCVYGKDEVMTLTVSDTGIGIAQAQQQAIFSRFYRVHNNQGEHVVGTGIGLALVKKIVDAHQGHIALSSQVGQGTSFRVCFSVNRLKGVSEQTDTVDPQLLSQEIKSIEQPQALVPATSDRQDNVEMPTLLVVDDNVDMLNYICQNLASEYRILQALDGQQGYELALAQVPDLIICDVMMPEKDGYELTTELRQNEMTCHIPIVLLTAKGDRQSKLKGFDVQVDDYLSKPFNLAELKSRIANLLALRRILRKRFAELITRQANDSMPMKQKHLALEAHDSAFLNKLDGVLEELFDEMELRIGTIADRLHLSERQLFRKLKATVDMSPTEYLRHFRLNKAVVLLKNGQKPSTVALSTGFSSASYFNKCFKAQFGLVPTQMQRGTGD